MASVDAKELLLQNKLLVAAYAVAAIPVVLWFVLVSAQASAADAALKTLNQSKAKLADFQKRVTQPPAEGEDPVYTEQDVTLLAKRRELYQAELNRLGEVVAERDAPLEKWFPKFDQLKPGEQPDFTEFVTEWNQRQIPSVVTRYKDLLGDSGRTNLFTEEPSRNEMRRFQKRFWIQEACLQALLKGGCKALLTRIDFPEVATGPQGQRHRVQFAFSASFTKVPEILRELLAQPITMRITQLKLTKTSFGYDKPVISGRQGYFVQQAYGATLEEASEFTGEMASQERWIPEPPVRADIELEVFDFGQSKTE